MKHLKTCPICQETFSTYSSSQIACSKACRTQSYGHVIQCAICGAPKRVHGSYAIKTLKTCGSPDCKTAYKKKYYRFTDERKARISAIAKERGFGKWSKGRKQGDKQRELARQRWIGEQNPRWKGGVSRKETHKSWSERNRDRVRFHNHQRKARHAAAPGKHSYQDWIDLKASFGNRCLKCERTEPEIKLTPDHIRALSRSGSNFINNIQPLCVECNTWKHVRYIDYRDRAFTTRLK